MLVISSNLDSQTLDVDKGDVPAFFRKVDRHTVKSLMADEFVAYRLTEDDRLDLEDLTGNAVDNAPVLDHKLGTGDKLLLRRGEEWTLIKFL